MSRKQLIVSAYLVVALLFAVYGWLWGANSYRGFAYNLGSGIVWPLVMFPGLGKIVGAVILVGVIAAVLIL